MLQLEGVEPSTAKMAKPRSDFLYEMFNCLFSSGAHYDDRTFPIWKACRIAFLSISQTNINWNTEMPYTLLGALMRRLQRLRYDRIHFHISSR